MISPETLASFFAHITLFDLVKVLFILGLIVYLAFAIIILRQVQIMNEALDDPRNPLVAIFAWIHLLLTILLLVVSFIFL